ncbi:hypothetical protein [Paraburkholderia bannensis]|uniref:hypothetical protein n=1 Tax=Paraburkholderia bannensis TaxID=765414 RepID=UPI002ABDFF3A|nr:hypothetical protein [Paraburkholderia bannensis]
MDAKELTDDFRGDTANLILSIKALLELDAEGALVPHGVGGHRRSLLSAAAVRLAATPSDAAQAPVKWQFRDRRDGEDAWSTWMDCPATFAERNKGNTQDYQFRPLYAAPVAPAAAAPINLEGLRKKLLAPREIVRNEDGYLTHPDFPICDEGTHAGKFLDAFGIDAEFVAMESDDPEAAERYFEAGEMHCSYWTPTPPEGEGWLLLEIYETEDGPCALFGRDRYEAENELKRQRMRAQLDRIQQLEADKGAAQ